MTLWPNLSGGEAIDLLGRLRGGLDEARRADLLERFELDPTKKGRAYSKGNRQKVALVAALASDVELLILDEPTSGLDPLMEEVFRSCVADERERGRTVLLSSHILSEVEALCDRVTIIRSGRTVETGTLAELRHLTRITIEADTADGEHVVEQVEPGELQARAGEARRARRDVAREPAADARGALPEALPVTGLWLLLRLALRRDRVMIPAWVLGLGRRGAAHLVLLRRALRGRVFAPRGRRDARARRPATLALYGRIYADSVGGLVAWRLGGIALALAGLMSILIVVRHTRAEEETGRAELVGAGVVGRHAPLAAALLAAAHRQRRARRRRRARRPRRRAGVHRRARARRSASRRSGWCSRAVAAVTAQVVESARAASGLAIGVLGGAFALRAIGDAGPHALAWFSPLGWAQAMRAFADERWWLLAPLLALAALLVAARGRARRPARPRRGHAAAAARARRAARCARRSRWPGGCSAARSRAGPPASRSSARPSARSRRTSAT